MAANDLYDLCAEYLAACAAALATSPGGTIGRAFVSSGAPAWDCCPQLSVHAGGPVEAETQPLGPLLQQGFRDVNQGLVNLVQMTATVLRCATQPANEGSLVPVANLDADAHTTLGDVWAIWNYVRQQHRAGTVFTRPDGQRREVLWEPAVALNPSGGCTGWQIGIRVQLDGYSAVV